MSITEVTKRPLTAACLFKTSIVALVDNLACKVRSEDALALALAPDQAVLERLYFWPF